MVVRYWQAERDSRESSGQKSRNLSRIIFRIIALKLLRWPALSKPCHSEEAQRRRVNEITPTASYRPRHVRHIPWTIRIPVTQETDRQTKEAREKETRQKERETGEKEKDSRECYRESERQTDSDRNRDRNRKREETGKTEERDTERQRHRKTERDRERKGKREREERQERDRREEGRTSQKPTDGRMIE